MPQFPTVVEVQYMEAHIGDNRKPTIIISGIVCLAAAYIAVVMRFYSRRLVRAGFKADDWWILAGLMMYTGFVILWCLVTKWGAGRHIILATNLKALFIATVTIASFYCAALLCVKLSILCLYNRIFPQRWFRIASIVTAAFIMAWTVAAFFTSLFQYAPISLGWDPEISGHRINYASSVRILAIFNIVSDFILLGLPMPLVWRIKITTTKKWQLTITFMLGGCACIVSIVRLFFVGKLGNTADSTWDDINGTICSAAELCVGILAACIATWRPLFSRKVRRPATCTRGLGKCHGNSASVGNTPSDQPSRTKITVNANGMIGRVKNDSDDKRLYTRMEEFEVEPVDERW